MSAIIEVESIGKKYILKHQEKEQYTALRDVITNSVKQFGKRIFNPFQRKSCQPDKEEFWALKDVSFEIQPGDRVGIIGRNGAGKSTLLKILSRITEPTTGRVRIKGRVASLLEVGTGFHPELTGRENIYLNGAILGMSRDEIKRKFDEIVEFAEVEKFLDTPVKRYSSGMYVRLAFAVAAHLEPEILIVDEVLAVGDVEFQKKCLGKMQDIGKQGRTVLFVSHNMNVIEQLCCSVILLEKGKVKRNERNIRDVIKDYIFGEEDNKLLSEWANRDGDAYQTVWFKPLRFRITDGKGNTLLMPVANNQDFFIEIEAEIAELDPALQVGYALYSDDGTLLYWTCNKDTAEDAWCEVKKGRNLFVSKIPKRLLNEGNYRIELLSALYFRQWLYEPGVNAPSISLSIQGGLSDSPYWMIKRPGLMAPVIEWNLTQGAK